MKSNQTEDVVFDTKYPGPGDEAVILAQLKLMMEEQGFAPIPGSRNKFSVYYDKLTDTTHGRITYYAYETQESGSEVQPDGEQA